MRYDFDEIIDRRGTNALNTDGFRGYIFHAGPEKVFPFKDEEFVRMWVADMDFATPPEICQAIKDRVDRRIFGYTMMYDSAYYEALRRWCNARYGWDFPEEELCFSPGIIPALYQLVEDLVARDEKVLTMTPAYGYFLHACEYNNVELVENKLRQEKGYFSLDLEDLEAKVADPKVKLLLLCNPHNPSGRVWSEEELRQIAAVAVRHDLWLVSDEIHCDLVRQGIRHTPMGKILPDYPRLITCMSASKTFNMAGLMFSDIIIRDPHERRLFRSRDKIAGMLNPLSIEAHKAAYEKCGDWLEQLKEYLDENFRFLERFLQEKLPQAIFSLPEATYLAWVNMSACLPGVEDLPAFFANEAGVLLEGGDSLFVGNARGWIRLNLAMPRSIIETGLNRMVESIQKYNKERNA